MAERKKDSGVFAALQAAQAGRARTIVATTAFTGAAVIVVVVARVVSEHGYRQFVGQRHQRISLRATEPAPRMLAQKENNEGEDEAETDREGERDDGHGGKVGLVRNDKGGDGGSGCGSERLLDGMNAAVVVAQQFLRGEPVIGLDAIAAAAFHPQAVGEFLDLGFRGFGQLRSRGSGFGFHGRCG